MYPREQTRVKSFKFQQVRESVADMGRVWWDLSLIKSNKRVKLEIKEGGKTPWNSIYVAANCESEIVIYQRETSEERSNLEESRGTSSLLKSSQQTDSGSSKMAAAGFCLKIKTNWYRLKTFFSDWDAIGINFAETSLRWQVTNLIQFSICLSVLRFVTTSRVNFCNLYKFFKKTMIFFLQNCTIFTLNKCGFTLNC